MQNEKPVISVEKQEEYYKRLSSIYVKNDEELLFIDQFLAGGGQELGGKFWRTISSARLCFVLYSWMGDDDDILDIRFEKKLRVIKSGRATVYSNMDVYFETEKDIFFIESKYTETVNNYGYKEGLPEAYWKEDDIYKSTTGKIVTCSIDERYFRRKEVMDAFLTFIKEVDEKARTESQEIWFDAKQETCHLLGIVMYAIDNQTKNDIHFNNIAANYSNNDFANWFRTKAERMVKDLFKLFNVEAGFEYKLCGVREFFTENDFFDKKGFRSDNTVYDLITDKESYEEEIR